MNAAVWTAELVAKLAADLRAAVGHPDDGDDRPGDQVLFLASIAADVLGQVREYLDTLTRAQRRGTELQDEARSLRAALHRRVERALGLLVPDLRFSNVCDMLANRWRADGKHGTAEHFRDMPDGTGDACAKAWVLVVKAECQRAERDGTLTWKKVMEEEIGEAFAETGEAELEAELLDVATVALKWRECIQLRREAKRALEEVDGAAAEAKALVGGEGGPG